MENRSKTPVDFIAEIKHETDPPDSEGAYLCSDGIHEYWIPKSQVISKSKVGKPDSNDYEIWIPEWLAIDKGIY